MPLVVADGLCKSYGPRVLLDHVSVALDDDARVGLLGDNGSGKSTLARILAGLEPADEGTVAVRRGARIGYLAQEPVLPPGSTVLEAVLEGLEGHHRATARYSVVTEALASGQGDATALVAEQETLLAEIEAGGGFDRDHEAESVLRGLGMRALDARCDALSGGEKRRVAIARLLVARPELIVLDEPTNHLDAAAIEWLEHHLGSRHRGAVLLVTHDRFLLDRVAERTLELDRGSLYSYEGGYEGFLEGRAAREAEAERAEANRRNFLRSELEWLRRSPSARRTKQKARVERAEAALSTRAPEQRRTADFGLETTRLGKTIVDLRGVTLRHGERVLVRDLDLCLRKGERIGIVGPNGAGKTTLIAAVLGTRAVDGGEIVRGDNTRFAYLDQSRSVLDDDATLEENVTAGHRRIEFAGRMMDSRAYLDRFGFDAAAQRKRVGTLSGGERARAALAKLLLVPANVLVLDEPTNDLDVATLSALESMMLEGDLTALVVSHDRYFLDRIATTILELDGEGGATPYVGNWDTYVRLKAQAAAAAKEAEEAERLAAAARKSQAAAPAAKAPAGKPKGKGLTYAESIELDKLVPRIEALEAELQQVTESLSDPAHYVGGAQPTALLGQRDALAKELDAATERWMLLEEKRG